MTISREIGLEMSFLNNRFGFDVSYYPYKYCGPDYSVFSDWLFR
jgi:hypothetical protein